jgi:hypothetical protein
MWNRWAAAHQHLKGGNAYDKSVRVSAFMKRFEQLGKSLLKIQKQQLYCPWFLI